VTWSLCLHALRIHSNRKSLGVEKDSVWLAAVFKELLPGHEEQA